MEDAVRKENKRNICIGLLAHVDAGKTTLSEAMLYLSGRIQKLGRVDHRDSFLDTHALERARGITIFSKQAIFTLPHASVTLLDTPGHADFSAEMERTLQVLDCAVLVVSGTDGVQAHTETLWRLLRRYGVPCFVFVTKRDLPGMEQDALMLQLQKRLGECCVDFSVPGPELDERLAVCSEQSMDRYLETGRLDEEDIAGMIRRRELCPCFFGSGLKLEGVEQLLDAIDRYAPAQSDRGDFAAKVFKIARDAQGNRLTYLKVTGGSLKVRAPLRLHTESGEEREEKCTQLRFYSGMKYETAESVYPGQVCAALGLSATWPGQGLGAEPDSPEQALEPVLSYRVLLPADVDAAALLPKLQLLGEEDPQLHVIWNERGREISVRLMGRIQTEVFRSLVKERFDVDVELDTGRILYRETIADTVEGVGHFEPLRHYAEVHLLLEPLPPGSGIVLDTVCPEDELDRNWQRLILTHLQEKQHLGVLTGSPVTDIKITLTAGRAHLKHTEGGDFRQATYRAVRQGLMQAQSVLLEPYYAFSRELPADQIGRA
ncbi:MAG: TetM/TetW/TetO/TetS family tetracycline resistance ribosomal protection protein, partial [Oscillospiraceae bacterium]|nr:TetM/TetW/TetO/TetS family tetracycline resistance ribosomal protection protein [Oscillospiraceae bacterium]